MAGRRVDEPDAPEARFPEEHVARVGEEIRAALKRLQATVLVCSAACGADILALEAAGELSIRRRIVLPFDRYQFRETSVVDRPGDWGDRYDRLLDDTELHGDVVVLGFHRDDARAYNATNDRILAEAEEAARSSDSRRTALIVWDGESRGSDDVTAQFLAKAC